MGRPSDKQQSSRASRGEWLVNVADDVVAPMTTLEVIDALRKGRLSEQSLVWRAGMHDWTAALDVPQLRLAASSRPPPPAMAAPESIAEVASGDEERESSARLGESEAPESSAEYVDSPDHFESVDDAELEDSEPVTTLMRESTATIQSSLAPTTAETTAPAPTPGAWSGIDELLSSEQRVEHQHTRRVVLWAALGSALLAAAFTLFVVRSKVRDESPLPTQAEQASSAAAPPPVQALPTATPEAVASASASASTAKRSPPTTRPPAKWGAPRYAKRPKHGAGITPPGDTPGDATADTGAAAPTVAVVPAAPLEPLPTSVASSSTPAPAGPTSNSP